jgi:hypothetical protein
VLGCRDDAGQTEDTNACVNSLVGGESGSIETGHSDGGGRTDPYGGEHLLTFLKENYNDYG